MIAQEYIGAIATMSEAKLQAARELINEKRYAAARALLLTIAHPDARAMLAELDAATGLHDIRLEADRTKEDFDETSDLFTPLEADFADDDFDGGGDE